MSDKPVNAAVDEAPPRDPLQALWDPATIRLRCAAVTRAVDEGRSGHFTIDRTQLPAVAQRVAAITRERFPDLRIPYHSRWRHFEAGGLDRKAELDAVMAAHGPAEVARARIDLTVVSVLLDAGAGAAWRYTEQPGHVDALALPVHRQRRDDLLAMLGQASGTAPAGPVSGSVDAAATASADALADAPADTPVDAPVRAPVATPAPEPAAQGRVYTRSEGLGVATFRAFVEGVFSSADAKTRVDAQALERLDVAALRAVFQASPSNPLVGLDGRVELLRRLGQVLVQQAQAQGGEARPGRLFDTLTQGGRLHEIRAADLLHELVHGYRTIWRSGSRVLGLPAGDVGSHLWAGAATAQGDDRSTAGYVPFHKLSQWLAYSLIEPFEWAGVRVTGLDALTGLPEYRNGGLLLDGGVIVPRSARDLARSWKPSDEFVVEWRALTVTLLDELAVLVRELLGATAEQLPLACILEGGTWAAGRQIAQELRPGGAPPLTIDSDGTVF